jgi:flagellar protein FlaG
MNDEIGMVRGGLGPANRASPAANVPPKPNEQAVQGSAPTKAEKDRDAADQVAEQIASGLNDLVQELHRELRFTVDRESGDTIIKVVDRDTDEVVRQIPSEEMVRLRKRLEEVSGIIFQDSA